MQTQNLQSHKNLRKCASEIVDRHTEQNEVSTTSNPGPSKLTKSVQKSASERVANVDRLLDAKDSECSSLPRSSESSECGRKLKVKTTCCDKISNQDLKSITIKPKGVQNIKTVKVVVPPQDLKRLLKAFNETKVSMQRSQQLQCTSTLCELILEVDLKNNPELIDWFVSPVKYEAQQGELVRRLVRLYRKGHVL